MLFQNADNGVMNECKDHDVVSGFPETSKQNAFFILGFSFKRFDLTIFFQTNP